MSRRASRGEDRAAEPTMGEFPGRGGAAILLAVGLFAALTARAAPEPRRDLPQTVADHTYEILPGEETLAGPGMEFLLREARASRFVGLGEPHNVRQVPELTTRLFRELNRRAGYDYLAVEQGPLIVRLLSEAARLGGAELTGGVARRYPTALHLDTDQELRMVAEVATVPGARMERVWGIDRTLAAEHVLDRLIRIAPDDEARSRTEEVLSEVRAHNAILYQNCRYLTYDHVARLEGLLPYFPGPPTDEAQALLRHLIRSHENIVLFRAAHRGNPTGYEASLMREELLKDTFLAFYRTAQSIGDAHPRVLLKFGHSHLVRGLNDGEISTLGNFLAEFGRADDSGAFLITVQPINRPGADYWSLTDFADLKPLADAGSPEAWRILDLRPLRGPIASGQFEVHEEVRKAAFAFDAMLLIGGASPGTREWRQGHEEEIPDGECPAVAPPPPPTDPP